MLSNQAFWRLMLFYTHLLLLLQPSVLWLSIVTLNNDTKPTQKWILRRFGESRIRVTPHWNVYIAKFDPGWEGYPVWQMGNYMDKQVVPPKRVTSSTWGPPPPCKQALKWYHWKHKRLRRHQIWKCYTN